MNRNPLSPSPAQENTPPSAAALPPEWVDRVLARLAAIFGSKMAELYAGRKIEDVRAEWARGLAGSTGNQLAAAINASVRRPWPPSLSEFLDLATPGPDYERLFCAAQAGDFRDPLAFWAAQDFGIELQSATWSTAERRWRRIVDARLAGEGATDPGEPRTNIFALKARARPGASVKSPNKPAPDWAQRIMADPGRYPEVSLAFARDAIRASGGRACSPS